MEIASTILHESIEVSYRRHRRPRPRRVLVVAPHPDDDAIGCGGTLTRLAASGAKIRVVYVTDGSASHTSIRFPAVRLRDVRELEARAALRVLGVVAEPLFLRAPDSGLSCLTQSARAELTYALTRQIVSFRAEFIFCPWLRDPHPDHTVTATLVDDAIKLSGRRRARQYFYRVWLPVRGGSGDEPGLQEVQTCEIRLTGEDVACKRAAIMEHRSQTGTLIDDDPDGFCITPMMLEAWLAPVERFYRRFT